ncbi:Fructose-1,6-bisphosphatase, partial [Bonamia ostreae]
LMNDNLRIPDGECFSVNTSYYQDWDRKTKNFINNCQNKKRMFRYIGSMVADVHRTLLHGGIFMYPPNNKFPNGKMKLTTEANTIAFLIESAGGKATDGEKSISLLQPSNNDDTTPIFAGSPKLIEEFEAS